MKGLRDIREPVLQIYSLPWAAPPEGSGRQESAHLSSFFTDKEAAQRGQAICPRSHSEEAAGSRLGPRPSTVGQSLSVGRRATSVAEAGQALCKPWRACGIRKYVKHSHKLTSKGQTIKRY